MIKYIGLGAAIIMISIFIGIVAIGQQIKHGKNVNADKGVSPRSEVPISNHSGGYSSQLSAILLVNSQSCPCTLERCRVAEEVVNCLENSYRDVVTFETIDYELQHEIAKPLFDKFNIFMIPVLIVLDKESHILWKCTEFSDEESIHNKFDELTGKSNAKAR